MSFLPCILIPIYNHKDSIAGTVERLLPRGLTLFIVDDGSDAATQSVLARLAQEQPLIRLLRLEHNQGKGGAVMHGLREARRAGFSHALQIDADGQHDAADVPLFLQRGAAHPQAVICGQPIYDASVPKGRLYGRYITHFWVVVETLSFAVGDSMCGFRLYPLASTCALLDSVALPRRMDFDTAILVRLVWRGVAIEKLPTRVIYPADGVSHFQMWRDNLRITTMHTVLFFGMLVRLPLLLWRKLGSPSTTSAHWSRLAERGSGVGLKLLALCYRALGPRAARALLYPVVAYFLLASGTARRASLDYLRRVHAYGQAHGAPAQRVPGWRESFRHLMAFAESGLDKLAAWMGAFDESRVAFAQRAQFEQLLSSGRGAVLIGSHLGNIEMARALAANNPGVVVNAIAHTLNAPRFNQTLEQANQRFGMNLIQVSQLGPETAMLLQDKVDRGELIVTFGDRTPPSPQGSTRVASVDFFDAPATFAQGPFILASLLDCPVYLFFCLREADGYHLYFELFAQRIELPRRTRAQALLTYQQAYAKRLQAYCLKAPTQWFNFYDFWRPEVAVDATKAPPHAG